MALVECLFEDTAIELEPAELTVDVAGQIGVGVQ
jgi:hypothetical protein